MPDQANNNTILIIDDDKFLLDMYSIKFGEYGYDVTSCLGSDDALKKIEEGFMPDIVLLDVVMPSMDGFELLEKITNENLLPNSTIIMLTNLGQQEDIEKGKSLGAKGYIVKASATPTEVVKQVGKFAGVSEGGDDTDDADDTGSTDTDVSESESEDAMLKSENKN